MKIVLCIAQNRQIWMQELSCMFGVLTAKKKTIGPNWLLADDTKYIYVSHPNKMKGFHDVDVLFLGPPVKDYRFYEEAEL